MLSGLSNTIDKLNDLYHNGLNGGKIEQTLFNSYFNELRNEGVKFSPAIPNITYDNIALNEYECKLYQKLQLIVSEENKANENRLIRYSGTMGDVNTSLIHELSILLMKRGVIEKKYFWKASGTNKIPNTVTAILNEIKPLLINKDMIDIDFMGKPLPGTIAFIRPGRHVVDMYKWWDKNGNYL